MKKNSVLDTAKNAEKCYLTMCTKATRKIGGITPIDKIFVSILVQVSSAWDFRMSAEIGVPLSLPLPPKSANESENSNPENS